MRGSAFVLRRAVSCQVLLVDAVADVGVLVLMVSSYFPWANGVINLM
jgi:hypothetical protein